MGGTDTLAEAQSFLASAGGPPHMLWDDRPAAWSHYNAGNPSLILLDGAGVERIERVGSFNRSSLQAALDGLG